MKERREVSMRLCNKKSMPRSVLLRALRWVRNCNRYNANREATEICRQALCFLNHGIIYRVSQEERSIFWEVTVTVILNKNFICTCVLFRTVSEIELFHSIVPILLITKIYHVLFLIPVFTVQVTKLI
jgi:hypothetical protein